MNLLVIINLTLLGWLWPFSDDDADNGKTIGSLEGTKVEIRVGELGEASGSSAMQQYRNYLELPGGDPVLRAEAMRRLADLNLEAGEYKQLEADSELSDRQFYLDAIKLYVALMDTYPNYQNTDLVLYQLARAYDNTGQQDRALETLNRMVRDYPDSAYADEAQFRRGEILFMQKQYESAVQAYAAVIASDSQSGFDEQGLYKYAWSLFKQADYNHAAEAFLQLLDRRLAASNAEELDQKLQEMTRPERELIEDTLRVLSLTFSYIEGADSINRYMENRSDRYYAYLLYTNLGTLYLAKERYLDAATTYKGFVEQQPNHAQSPLLFAEAIEVYRIGRFPTLVLEAKRDYVTAYGLDSPYWTHYDPATRPDVLDPLKTNLGDLAQYDHALAQESGDRADYERAAGWYRQYLEYFPEDPDSAQRSFLLAEILTESGHLAEATTFYLRAAYRYPEYEKAAEAAYAGLLASSSHLDSLSGSQKETWEAAHLEMAFRFVKTFPEHEQAAAVTTNVAEELFAAGRLVEAAAIGGLVVTMQPPATPELERVAWTVIAHANFDLHNYADAERAYLRLRDLPVETQEVRQEIEERIGASVYKQAEAQQASGNTEAALASFLRVGQAAPKSAVRSNATYDAAALLMSSAQYDGAIRVLEGFRASFPEHEFSDDVTQKLAVAYFESGHSDKAAAEFEQIANLDGVDASVLREAQWRAAELYEKAGNAPKARRAYAQFIEQFPYPIDESIEARQKLADLSRANGDYKARRQWLQSIIAADASAGVQRNDRSRYLAATASLEMADPLRDAFVAVKLTVPLPASLKLKKSRMELALAAYNKAAAYAVSDVTTAATYEIAQLYYGLGQDLLASERPGELDSDALEQYEILLEEQAFPIEEKAIELFEANVARVSEGIYDEWVRKSFGQLALLMPARYAKPERRESYVARLD
jgi:TolA-binding protein